MGRQAGMKTDAEFEGKTEKIKQTNLPNMRFKSNDTDPFVK